MRTKIVYVLVSQESDYYYEMFLLSHYSLRLHHPKGDAEVVLVMDTDTHQRLVDKKAPVLNDVTPVVVSIPEGYTTMQRSRYLKTQLRQIVKGDFLYLDTDTIICRSLEDIDKVEVDMAMVADINGELFLLQSQDCIDRCKAAGFPDVIGKPMFNSGVAFVRDTETARNLFANWFSYWKISLDNGIPYDQPALSKANMESGYPIIEISGVWNCQIFTKESAKYKNNKKIIHYYTFFHNSASDLLFRQVKLKGYIDNSLKSLVCNPSYELCYSVFNSNDKNLYGYLFSEMFPVYIDTPRLFRFSVAMSRFFRKPIVLLWRMKQVILSIRGYK